MLAELWRAARPPTTARSRIRTGDLHALAGWQHAQFGTWSDYEGIWVGDDEALGLPVISASIDIATALAVQMGLHAYTDGQRQSTDPPVLRNPAPGPGRTLADWVREYLRATMLHGNYVAVLGDNSWTGWPEWMYPVPNGQWTVEQNDRGIWYTIGSTRYPAADIFHVMRNAEVGDLAGRGLLDTHRPLLASSVAAERWATRYFEGGAVPPAQIEHPDPDLTQPQADALKAKYDAATRLRKALVTPAGVKVNALASDAEKAQLADTRRANDQKLAMACGMPGALLGLDAPSLTYRNITDVFQQYLSTTVMGYLEPLEQELTQFCLPRGTEARFDVSAVLRPDLAARVTIAVQAYGAGLLTLNEGRALLDLSPVDAGAEPATPAGESPALEVVA